MAVTYVDVASAFGTATYAPPGTVTTGDLMVACIGSRHAGWTSDAVDISPTGWHQVSPGAHTTDSDIGMWWKIKEAGDPANWTWTPFGTTSTSGGILVFRGTDTVIPIGPVSAHAEVGDPVTVPGITTGHYAEMLVMSAGHRNSGALSVASMTEVFEVGAGGSAQNHHRMSGNYSTTTIDTATGSRVVDMTGSVAGYGGGGVLAAISGPIPKGSVQMVVV